MRFINWLHNGQGSGDTESGVYEISNGISELRSPTSKYFIPSENEWYKVAYYQSAADGGDTDNYWLYPTGTNSDPTPAIVDANGVVQNSGANVANFERGADWNGLNGNVTKVTDSGGASYYGVFDLAGNVMEWTEGIEGDSRILRGASWKSERPGLESNATDTWPPAITENNFGFRVAAPIPDPWPPIGVPTPGHLRTGNCSTGRSHMYSAIDYSMRHAVNCVTSASVTAPSACKSPAQYEQGGDTSSRIKSINAIISRPLMFESQFKSQGSHSSVAWLLATWSSW